MVRGRGGGGEGRGGRVERRKWRQKRDRKHREEGLEQRGKVGLFASSRFHKNNNHKAQRKADCVLVPLCYHVNSTEHKRPTLTHTLKD